jgi:outer membrane protein OmpA-like peptidoglycan-associated protein
VPLPASVNSEFSDISPTFFGNNDELLFMSTRDDRSNSDDAVFRVFHAQRISETEWKSPTRVDAFGAFTLFNAKIEVVNKDGKAFVFSKGKLNYSEPTTESRSWTTPREFDSKLSSDYVESHFFINDDEDVIIFSSDKNVEGISLYESRKDKSTGEWSEPKLLPSTVNSEYFEDSPFLSHDGQYLYFSSNRESSIGGYDIYRSKWDAKNNTWMEAENLGYPINTIDDEIHFQLNEDNNSGYFSSNRLHSQGDYDIYYFKKEVMITVNGIAKDDNGNPISNKELVFRPAKYTDETFTANTDENGNYSVELFQNEPFIAQLSDDNQESNKVDFTPTGNGSFKKDLVFTMADKPQTTTDIAVADSEEDIKRQEEELASIENIGSKYRSASSVDINNIYFETDSDKITSQSEGIIVTITEMMTTFPDAQIKIIGHTDNVGNADYNLGLSKRRANSLKNELVKRGINENRITTEGKGESDPIASNLQEKEGRALNRRIEIKVID